MPQIINLVNVTNGSATVIVTGVDLTGQLPVLSVFMKRGAAIPYFVASSSYSAPNTTVTLTGNYAGVSESGIDGVFSVDMTSPDNIPTISPGDANTAAVFTAAMNRIQQKLTTDSPASVPAETLRGNASASAGPVADLSIATVQTLLGLESAAYQLSTAFATAAQGATADAALPKAGGTMTGAINEAPIVTVASATTVDIGAAGANTISVTGTTTITGLGTIASGVERRIVFAGALTLTHNATSLILPTGVDIPTAVGDVADFVSLGSGNWRCVNYMKASGHATYERKVIPIAVGDEVTAITTGVAKVTFRMPFAMTLTEVRASLTTASSSGAPTVDINESGTTILSTKLTIDASERTSTTAATPAVISDAALTDDAEITIDIDAAGTGAAGLKVYLIGR